MMNNRISLSRLFLESKGMLATAIDDFQQKELHFLLRWHMEKKTCSAWLLFEAIHPVVQGRRDFLLLTNMSSLSLENLI